MEGNELDSESESTFAFAAQCKEFTAKPTMRSKLVALLELFAVELLFMRKRGATRAKASK